MSAAEEIKSRLDIVDVLREYIQVKAVGANFQALCPFHREKTPSFIISPDKQIWHCFGCNQGGDIFSFVMEMESLSFVEALRLLAPKAGVTLEAETGKDHSRRRRLLALLKLASDYYARLLNQDEAGETCRQYLLDRGLNRETLSLWSIGYSRDSWDDALKFFRGQTALGRQFTDEEIFAAGLSTKKEGTNRYFDRFRARIMFPIKDQSGQVVAFSARIDPSQEEKVSLGKYINSPQTEVYDKSSILFGLDQAKTAIKEQGWALIVEGQMDVITCHQHGFKNAVASSGTALTRQQLQLIKRYSENIALAFDMDKAGQLAADRGIQEAMQLDMRIKVIVLPAGYKDPADCLLADPEAFKQAVLNSQPMMEYYFSKTLADRNLQDLEEKRNVSQIILKMIVKLASRLDQDFWFKRLSETIDVPEYILRESASALIDPSPVNTEINKQAVPDQPQTSRSEKISELLLALLLKFPALIPYAITNLEPDYLAGEVFPSVYKNLIIYYNKFATFDYQPFAHYLSEHDQVATKFLDRLALLGERDYYNFTSDQAKAEFITALMELKRYFYQQQVKILEKKISQAEAAGQTEELESLMQELKKITDNFKKLS